MTLDKRNLPERQARRMTAAAVALTPWTGSPDQRRAYFEMKERERHDRAQRLIANRKARIRAETDKRAAELARQDQRRAQADAERRAREIVARAQGH